MSGQGRGRGQSSKLTELEEASQATSSRYVGVLRPDSNLPVLDLPGTSGSSSPESSSSSEKMIRGRGGFRSQELHTIPAGITQVRAPPDARGQPIEVLSNFVRIEPMKERQVYSYRVDFEPNVESVRLRGQLFRRATETLLPNAIYDNAAEARCSVKLQDEVTRVTATHDSDADTTWTLTIKRVSEVNYGTFEMLRVYNMHMKEFLRAMKFFQVQSGAYIHPDLSTRVGQTGLLMVRGYRTGANVHEENEILMNLESVHKLIQHQNLLQYMNNIRQMGGNMRENVKAALTGKLVVTSYNKIVYRIEDVNFQMNAASTFLDHRTGQQVSYLDYYRTKHNVNIQVRDQPLLLAIQNNNRRQREQQGGDEAQKDIYIVPELCNMAGLTDQQRSDNRLKVDLIKTSQIDPRTRVEHLETFLSKLHSTEIVTRRLNQWGYSYANQPIKVKARILPLEQLGAGRAASGGPPTWPKVEHDGGFERLVVREPLARMPPFKKLVILIAKSEANCEQQILNKLRDGFAKLHIKPDAIEVIRMREGDSPQIYVQYLRQIPLTTTCTIVLVTNQNKEKYNAIKKLASVEAGYVTQVVTARLMTDDRKAGGAAVKIGIQIAAKIGGEPWFVHIPIQGIMICGYDTYHDTATRGRSYGAFVASMNNRQSRWYSKADSHDHLDELSSHMAENLGNAIRKYCDLNEKQNLRRIIIYRDGVGDGQLEHVYNVEMKQCIKVIKDFDKEIQFTFVVVNKRVGARFYMCNNRSYINPPPGSVIDNVVTRKERFDFYLVSQSTRHGVVAPTYYNVLYDNSGMAPDRHQALAFKLCFLYYNWTGTVRVPAPCQYAHKLALLCGEHLHAVPSTNLDDKLHFL